MHGPTRLDVLLEGFSLLLLSGTLSAFLLEAKRKGF